MQPLIKWNTKLRPNSIRQHVCRDNYSPLGRLVLKRLAEITGTSPRYTSLAVKRRTLRLKYALDTEQEAQRLHDELRVAGDILYEELGVEVVGVVRSQSTRVQIRPVEEMPPTTQTSN